MGFSGDRTQHVLWRLDNGNIDGISPKVAVIMIGTNNSNGNDNTAEEIADGKMIHYLDIGPKFLQPDKSISKEIMPDFLHLTPRGYQIWAESIESTIVKLMGEKK